MDFGFVVDQLSNDITDDKLKSLVGDPLLKELDKVSVEPIEEVKKLSESEYTIMFKPYILVTPGVPHNY